MDLNVDIGVIDGFLCKSPSMLVLVEDNVVNEGNFRSKD